MQTCLILEEVRKLHLGQVPPAGKGNGPIQVPERSLASEMLIASKLQSFPNASGSLLLLLARVVKETYLCQANQKTATEAYFYHFSSAIQFATSNESHKPLFQTATSLYRTISSQQSQVNKRTSKAKGRDSTASIPVFGHNW